jgi:hypothetical protein
MVMEGQREGLNSYAITDDQVLRVLRLAVVSDLDLAEYEEYFPVDESSSVFYQPSEDSINIFFNDHLYSGYPILIYP